MSEESRKRNRCFNVRLLEEELAILDAKADEAQMTKSEYIRNMILFGAAHERANFSKKDTKAMLYELNRIGNNINQIAYATNVTRVIREDDFVSLRFNFIDLLGQYEKLI